MTSDQSDALQMVGVKATLDSRDRWGIAVNHCEAGAEITMPGQPKMRRTEQGTWETVIEETP